MIKNALFCLIVTLCSTLGVMYLASLPRTNYLCKCLIFPNGTPEKTYLIKVSRDSVITTIVGNRSHYINIMIAREKYADLEGDSVFSDIRRHSSRKLSPSEYAFIKNSLGNLRDEECENYFINDSWSELLQFGNNQYLIFLGNKKQEKFADFIRALMNMSPMPIDKTRWTW